MKSKNHHGVHSPFVFDLLTKCLYEKSTPNGFQQWKNYRDELANNRDYIDVTDFGAGSKIFKSNRRLVSRIAKHVGISTKRARLLIKLVKYFQFGSVLELGTSLGLGTAAISLGNPKSQIISLEGCEQTSGLAKQTLSKYKLNNVAIIQGNFKETLIDYLNRVTYDLIYFDGNHSKEATLEYFKASLQSIHNDSLLIFDDIHWSKEMEQAWEQIKTHHKVTVTIDTFQWGLVFFRKEQQKEHFIIRV